MVMKPSKHQRSKQRCQDLGRKVHDPAQSFVLPSYTMHDYVTNTFLLVSSSVRSKQLLCFVHCQGLVKAQKRNKNLQQRTFVGFHNHSPLLTMLWRNGEKIPWDQQNFTGSGIKILNTFGIRDKKLG